ncbi:DUF4382 domain-containing protein [Aurantibacillus circumpalustris]|uniref:DUF4382 domain-containing protein n=1 Tax=Aurantibacillus circumpalustris TaxID=3036359 RepID=UPI00295B262A|nr:DUF4382 domain-containing protein [Aurantibacillus circumpalustris]
MKTRGIILCCLALGAIFSSCKKDKTPEPDPAKPTPYYINMTDAPGPYTAVYIDLQAVEITGNGNSTMLNANAGVYNLLDLANGIDTLIATGSLTVDKVQQIRLILGTNNSVVKGGVTYSLSTPSAQQSGLKLQVHQELQAGIAYYVLLDFDASQSIVEEGNGSYSLKPVIRTIETALSGSIKGKLSQAGVLATITANSGGTSYSTVANSNGEFIITGLPAGMYTVTVYPSSPFLVSTLTNINVTVGNTTLLGTIII